MRAGPMDQRVTILTPTRASSTQSASGTISWSTLAASVAASVKALSGSEVLAARSLTSQVTYEVAMRYRSDVEPKMRVQWTPFSGSARTFEIHAVQVNGRTDGGMVLLCGETS